MKRSPDRLRQEMVAIMRAACMPPHLIYAYEKTGLLLSEDGYNTLSPADKAEYDAAIDEYFVNNTKRS